MTGTPALARPHAASHPARPPPITWTGGGGDDIMVLRCRLTEASLSRASDSGGAAPAQPRRGATNLPAASSDIFGPHEAIMLGRAGGSAPTGCGWTSDTRTGSPPRAPRTETQ